MDDWGKVVTRYPYENVGMDHLLSREIFKVRMFYSVLRDHAPIFLWGHVFLYLNFNLG